MAVTSTASYITYVSNGFSRLYPFPYYFISQQDLLVQGSLNGVITNYVLNTDYTITGTPNAFGDYNNGGSISFNPSAPPPSLSTLLLIARNTPKTQTIILIDNAAYTADTFNHVFDKLTLIVQETGLAGANNGFLGVALGPPSSGTFAVGNWYQIVPSIPGGMFGTVCTTAGSPGTWNAFGNISLL